MAINTWDPGREAHLESALPRFCDRAGTSTRRAPTGSASEHAGCGGLRDGGRLC
jgi:hypothetical protein